MRKTAEPNSLNAQLAQCIRQLRTQKGLSQEELARLASVDRTYISGIERARRNITVSTLERLIPHLSSSSTEFFESLCQEIQKNDASQSIVVPIERAIKTSSLAG